MNKLFTDGVPSEPMVIDTGSDVLSIEALSINEDMADLEASIKNTESAISMGHTVLESLDRQISNEEKMVDVDATKVALSNESILLAYSALGIPMDTMTKGFIGCEDYENFAQISLEEKQGVAQRIKSAIKRNEANAATQRKAWGSLFAKWFSSNEGIFAKLKGKAKDLGDVKSKDLSSGEVKAVYKRFYSSIAMFGAVDSGNIGKFLGSVVDATTNAPDNWLNLFESGYYTDILKDPKKVGEELIKDITYLEKETMNLVKKVSGNPITPKMIEAADSKYFDSVGKDREVVGVVPINISGSNINCIVLVLESDDIPKQGVVKYLRLETAEFTKYGAFAGVFSSSLFKEAEKSVGLLSLKDIVATIDAAEKIFKTVTPNSKKVDVGIGKVLKNVGFIKTFATDLSATLQGSVAAGVVDWFTKETFSKRVLAPSTRDVLNNTMSNGFDLTTAGFKTVKNLLALAEINMKHYK